MNPLIITAFTIGGAIVGYWIGRPKSHRITIDDEGHWHFPIDTLRQMLTIPVERRQRFLAELPDMFTNMWELMDEFPTTPDRGAYWIDDDLGEFRPQVSNPVRNLDPKLTRRRPLKGER